MRGCRKATVGELGRSGKGDSDAPFKIYMTSCRKATESNAVETLGRQLQAGQGSPVDRAGVDTDLIGCNKYPLQRGVPEDDCLAVVVRREDKLIPDPDEVVRVLFLQGYSSPYSCVDKDVFLRLIVQEQRGEEIKMLLGQLELTILGIRCDGGRAAVVEVEVIVFPVEDPVE